MKAAVLFVLLSTSTMAHAADCQPTPSRTIGTHYDISKATHQPGDIGDGLLMSGRVLSANDCKPIPNVKVLHWQAGESGRYEDRLYAWRHTDKSGAFRFETEWPALNPPHIHFMVEAPGHEPLATQWIADEPVGEAQIDLVLQPK